MADMRYTSKNTNAENVPMILDRHKEWYSFFWQGEDEQKIPDNQIGKHGRVKHLIKEKIRFTEMFRGKCIRLGKSNVDILDKELAVYREILSVLEGATS